MAWPRVKARPANDNTYPFELPLLVFPSTSITYRLRIAEGVASYHREHVLIRGYEPVLHTYYWGSIPHTLDTIILDTDY